MPKSADKMKAVKERLFQAAMALFDQKGYDNTTVAEIARKAGVSKGTFFTHFPAKDAVFSAIGNILAEYMQEIVETGLAEKQSTRHILLELIGMADAWCEENKKLIGQVMVSGMYHAAMGTRSTSNRLAVTDMLRRMLEAGKQKGDIAAVVASEDAARMLVGLFFSMMFDWIHDGGAWSLKEKLTACLDLLFRGIGP